MKTTARLRQAFYQRLFHGLHIVWPVLSGLIFILIAIGMAVSLLQGWRLLDGIYFAFVTGLTVGYGDLVPSHSISRILAIAAAFDGILMTALLAGVAVHAMQKSESELTDAD